MNISFKNILNSIYVLAIIFTIMIMVFSPSVKTSNTVDFQRPQAIDNALVEYVDKDDYSKKSSYHLLPYGIKTQDMFKVQVSLDNIDNLEEKSFNVFSTYTDFDCYIDGKNIYSNHNSKNGIIYSSGTLVNYVIDFPDKIQNKTLTIRFTPTLRYNQVFLIHPISVGYRTTFFTPVLIKDELASISISVFLIFVFLVSVILSAFFIKKETNMKITLNIGLLSLLFSAYSFACYRSVLYIFSKYRLFIYYLEYVSLLLIPLPIINLIYIYSDEKYNKFLSVLKNIVLINCLVQMFSTFNAVIEFKDLLPFSTILIILSCIIPLIVLFSSKSKKVERRRIVLSLVPVLIILIIGIGAYNFLGQFQITSFVLLLAMTFILIQMTSLISAYAKVMQENEKTERYKALVSYDALTSMGSRHSFEEHIESLRKAPKDTTFISADLNNLKLINDKMGHNYGDVAIIEVGRFLHESFEDSDIYRIGGDEYVIIHDGIIDEVHINSVKNKKIYVKDISDEMDVTVSIGHFNYYADNNKGYTVDDALRFSDIHMYENKKNYKEKTNGFDENINTNLL